MPRKRVKSKRRNKNNIVPAWQWHFLCFGIIPADTGGGLILFGFLDLSMVALVMVANTFHPPLLTHGQFVAPIY